MGNVAKCDVQSVLYHAFWAATDTAAQLHADGEKMAACQYDTWTSWLQVPTAWVMCSRLGLGVPWQHSRAVWLPNEPVIGSETSKFDVPKCDIYTVLYHGCWAAMNTAA
jgi:hypothetical protein